MNADRGESLAWDGVGRLLQQAGTKASDIADRNIELWSVISEHLRSDRYTADEMADDMARSISTAVSNASDVWSIFTRDSDQNTIARPIPTAFLLFDWVGTSRHRLLDPVRIEAGSLPGRDSLPKHARVELNGTRAPLSDGEAEAHRKGEWVATSEDGVNRLRECLVAYRDGNSAAYIIANVNRSIETPPKSDEVRRMARETGKSSWSIEGLIPGVYDGIVYLTDPAAALANLRILVEGAPPDPPIVSEEAAPTSEGMTV